MRALWLLAVSSTIVGCLDDNKPAPQPAAESPKAELPSRRAPEPKPQVAQAPKVDLSLGEGYEMRRPISDGRLTIIPIITTHAAPMQKFVTLHDGMRKGIVSVREVGGSDEWEVDTVRVTNQSNEPLVILEGELIEDAMQDRITAENVVIDPHKTQRISVRCVEEDRDHGGTVFHSGNAIAELSLRRTLVHQSQEAVWSKVKQINSREKLYPSTNTYRLAAHAQIKGDGGVRRDRIVKQLEALEERPNIVGFAVAIDGKVVAMDRFATPDLYRQLEGELLASYIPTTSGDAQEGRRIAPDQVRALLSSTTGSQTSAVKTVIKAL
jgi:hypothetical protein